MQECKKWATSLACAAGVLCFGVSPLAAQWEVSGGAGVHVHRLTEWGGERSVFFPRVTYASPAATLAIGYRPHERVAVRARLEGAERAVASNLADLGVESALSLSTGLEAVTYLRPWLAVGAGLGYNHLRLRDGALGGLWPGGTTTAEELGLRSHFVAHVAAEAHAGPFALRVAPSASVGRVYGQELARINGWDRLRGSWLGLSTSLLYRVPFGKTGYDAPTGLTRVLATAVERGGGTTERWGLGPVVEHTTAVLNVGGVGDGYDLRPARLRAGLQSTYALDEDWHLRLSAGWNKFRSTSRLSPAALERRDQLRANFRGVDVMVGAERRVWRHLTVAADVGAVKVYEEYVENLSREDAWVTSRGGSLPLVPADNSPVADFVWLADLRADWALAGRLRLGAQAQVTLSDVNSDSPDALLAPARPRTGGYLGAGVHAAWMVLAD